MLGTISIEDDNPKKKLKYTIETRFDVEKYYYFVA